MNEMKINSVRDFGQLYNSFDREYLWNALSHRQAENSVINYDPSTFDDFHVWQITWYRHIYESRNNALCWLECAELSTKCLQQSS